MKQKLLLTIIMMTVMLSYSQTKIESSIQQNYDGSSYTDIAGSNYEYDSYGNLLSETSYSWNGTQWSESFKLLYTYNSNNKATEEVFQNWDGTQHINSFRANYIYNSNNLLVEIIQQDWNNNQWENSSRTIVNYNSNEISEAINQEWNGSQWVNSDRSTLTYTGNNLTQVLNEDWNGSQWTSVDSDRDVFTYNSNNKKTTYIFETWNGTSWDEEERIEYVLDATENRSSETEIYNGSNQTRFEYNYDTSALLTNFFHPFKDKTGIDYLYQDFPYVNKITSQTILSYNTSTGNFDISGRINYDYDNPITLSIQNFEVENTMNIYPNPSSDFISINGLQKNETIKIYSVLGNVVKVKNIIPNEKIDIKELNNGIYFLKMDSGTTIKFVKK